MVSNDPAEPRLRIGVLLPEVDGEYYRPLVDGVCRRARELDVDLMFYPGHLPGTPVGFERQLGAVFELVDSDILDGLLIFASTLQFYLDEQGMRDFLARFEHMQAVCVGLETVQWPVVMLDNHSGFKKLVQHFIEVHGHTRIAMIEGPPDNRDAQERLQAYLDAHRDAGLIPDPMLRVVGAFSQHTAREAMDMLWSRGEPFSAIVCANDEMAQGALAAAVDRGIDSPSGLAIGGFDDLLSIYRTGPSLTTVNQAIDTQGATALTLLVDSLRGEDVPQYVPIETRLVLRSSCGCHGSSTLSERAGLLAQLARDMARTESSFAIANALSRELLSLRDAIHTLELSENRRQVVQRDNALDFRIQFKARVTTDNLEDLLAELGEGLKNLGVGTCLIALYREPLTLDQMRDEGMPSSSRLIFAMHEGRLRPEWVDQDFSTCRLSPENVSIGSGATERVVLPMFYLQEHFGFIVIDRQAETGLRCEDLRHELSTYIHHCLLVRDLANARDLLRSDLARVQRDNEALSHLAMRDELTGLFNRRGFFELAHTLLSTARITSKPVTLIFADLDGLKQINDTHGHEEGDVAIREAGRLLRDTFRQDDIVSRIGGDEFVVLTRIHNLDSLPEIEKRLAKAFDDYNAACGKPYALGCSVGGYVIPVDSKETLEDVLAQADRLLYATKRRKRAQREGRASKF
jgi:diguanylate cyclase (GGDEF)-like protein